MNTISIFIYLADVFNNVGGFLRFLAVAGVLVGIAGIIISTILVAAQKEEVADMEDRKRAERTIEPYKWFLSCSLKVFIGSFLFGVVAIMVPSKDTMYAIAASEISEEVIISDEGKEIMADVKAYIKHQLKVPQDNTDKE